MTYTNVTRELGKSVFIGVTPDAQNNTLRFREKVGTYTPPGGGGAKIEMVNHVTRLEVLVDVQVGDSTVKVPRSVEIRFNVESGADTQAAALLAECLRVDTIARTELFALRGVTPPSEATFASA